MNKFLKIGLVLFVLLAIAGSVSAQIPAGSPFTLPIIRNLIVQVADFLIVVSIVLAVIFIIWAGITYMAAGSDTAKVTKATDRLKAGVIGAAIILGTGAILRTVMALLDRSFFG